MNLLKSHDFKFASSDRFLDQNYSKSSHLDQINQILYNISKEWLIENVLMKSDKVTMSSSLECRCPFLDIELAEFYFHNQEMKKYIIKVF